MLSIQTNVNSMNAQENLRMTNDFQARTIARLTSGYRINQSGDDAAGLAVANKYRSDVAELTQGVRNANDGLSTLQVIDSGLSNISKILDRLKTLATESASSTFEGNRSTLNTEYQDLLAEVDRQAGMVGLSSGTEGGRYNRDIEVYVGGAQQGTPKVTVKLGGAANRVDSAGLSLSGTTIADGGATALGNDDIRNQTALLAGATQVYTVQVGKENQSPYSVSVTVDGGTSGISTEDALSQLNDGLSGHGISASLDSSGVLQFSGDVAFVVTAAAAGGGTAVSDAGTISNTGQYVVNSDSWATDATADLTFSVGTQSVTVSNASAGATRAAAATLINAQTKSLGIYAFDDGTNIVFQSKAGFSVTEANDTAGAAGVFDNATAYDAARTSTGTSTSSAESAITAIAAAVESLGLVQGKVGTGQNKISYAIQLAQSQITNFSSAESRIRDADVASEAANLTKAQVLQQASLAALAQANSAPQAVLSLLRG